MPPPELPTWQDCHELWSKQRRRQQREEQQGKKPYFSEDSKSNDQTDFKTDGFKPSEPPPDVVGQVKQYSDTVIGSYFVHGFSCDIASEVKFGALSEMRTCLTTVRQLSFGREVRSNGCGRALEWHTRNNRVN